MITVPGVAPDMIANNLEPYRPIHPGEVLKDEIEYRGLSQRRLAAKMGVPHVALNEILNAKRPITAEYAMLFEAALGIDSESLLRMQTRYNAQAVRKSKTAEVLIQRRKSRAYRITPMPDGGMAKSRQLEDAVMCLYDDYKHNDELTIFTQLDGDDFYEAR